MSLIPILIVATLAAVGALLLKNGATQIGTFSLELSTLSRLATNLSIVLGFILYGGSALIWLTLLSKGDLSKLYPVFVGFDFMIVSLLSFFILKEDFSLTRIAGILLLLIGIYLISRS